jgi:hypothetical protein
LSKGTEKLLYGGAKLKLDIFSRQQNILQNRRFTFTGPGSRVPIEGTINSEKYSDILKCRVVKIMEENLPNSDEIFHCDLAPCHSSRKVKKVIEEL